MLISILFLVSLSACSLIPDSSSTESLTVNYLLSKATTRIIDGEAARATKVLAATADARNYIATGDSVTVELLYDEAIKRIVGMDPADQVLLTAILDNARARLETAISGGELNADQRVSLLDTLTWIEATAKSYL